MLKKIKTLISLKHRPTFIAWFTIFFWLVIIASNINQILNLSEHITDEGDLSPTSASESRVAADIIAKYQEDNSSFFLVIRTNNGSSILTEGMYKTVQEIEKNITSNLFIGPYLSSFSPYSSIFDTFDNLLRTVLNLQWFSTKFMIAAASSVWGGINLFCENWLYYYNISGNLTSSVENAEYFTNESISEHILSINSSIFLSIANSFIENFSTLFFKNIKDIEIFPQSLPQAILFSASLIEDNRTFFSQLVDDKRFLDALVFLSSSFNYSLWNDYNYILSKTAEFLFNSSDEQTVNYVSEVYANGSLTGFVQAKNKYLLPLLRLEKSIPVISEEMITSLLTLYTNYNETKEPDTMIIVFNSALSYKTKNGYRLYKELLHVLPLLKENNPSLSIEVTGFDLFIFELTEDSEKQSKRMDIIVISFLVVLLVLAYRSPILPLIQILTIGIAFVVSRSVFLFVSRTIYPLASTSLILMSINLLGATTDYSIFLIGDYLLMYKKYKNKKEALKETLQRTAKSIIVSSFSLAIGFGSLIFARIPSIKGLGIGGSIGFLSGMIVSLTVIPSCLLLIKQKFLVKWQLKKRILPNLNLFEKAQKLVIKNPFRIFLISVILSSLCFGLFFVTPLDYSQLSTAPDKYISKQGFNAVSEHLGEDRLNQIILLIKLPEKESFILENDSLNYDAIKKIELIMGELLKVTNFTFINGISHPVGKPFFESTENSSYFLNEEIELVARNYILPDEHYAIVSCGSPYKENDRRLDEQVLVVREKVKELLEKHEYNNWEILITGFPVTLSDAKRIIEEDFLIIAAIILSSTLILLVFFMKNFFMAFRILLTIVISLGVNLGLFSIFAYIFFGGKILFIVPIILFSVLISLGLDFDILFLGIFNRLYKSSNNIEESMFGSVKQTMTNISLAGIIMIFTYFSLVFTGSLQMIQIGLGLSIGIFIDVFISRIFIVPSAVILTSKFENLIKRRRKSEN